MATAFLPCKRAGQYWDSLQKIKSIIEKLSLDIKTEEERKFEDRISGALQTYFPEFIDQRNIKQTITRVTLFGHDHRPDMSIGSDGIAIEVKVAKTGQSFREAIGQAFMYRMGYRFVLVIWVDITKEKLYKQVLLDEETKEKEFLAALEEHNIFCIIK